MDPILEYCSRFLKLMQQILDGKVTEDENEKYPRD